MNQIEEFTKYYYPQIQEEESKINVKQDESNKKCQQKMDSSNRLNITHKRYTTYTMEYKKQIIQEVKIKLIIILQF